jgi:hypothetical protein
MRKENLEKFWRGSFGGAELFMQTHFHLQGAQQPLRQVTQFRLAVLHRNATGIDV